MHHSSSKIWSISPNTLTHDFRRKSKARSFEFSSLSPNSSTHGFRRKRSACCRYARHSTVTTVNTARTIDIITQIFTIYQATLNETSPSSNQHWRWIAKLFWSQSLSSFFSQQSWQEATIMHTGTPTTMTEKNFYVDFSMRSTLRETSTAADSFHSHDILSDASKELTQLILSTICTP